MKPTDPSVKVNGNIRCMAIKLDTKLQYRLNLKLKLSCSVGKPVSRLNQQEARRSRVPGDVLMVAQLELDLPAETHCVDKVWLSLCAHAAADFVSKVLPFLKRLKEF